MSVDVCTALGAVGAILVIVAYFVTQQRWLSAHDWRYPAANLIGAVLIIASLFADWNLPAFVIEVFWLFISLYGLMRALRRR
jgi:hypothetical protein